MIKVSIQKNMTLVNDYAPNIEAPSYVKQILTDLTSQIDSSTIIVEDFNTSFSSMGRSSKREKSVRKQWP